MAYTGVVSGEITSVNALAANQMPDVDRVLYLLKPYQTPIFNWLYFSQGANKSEKIINSSAKFSWFEDEFYPHQTSLTTLGGGASSTTTITVGDSSIFNDGDILFVEATDQLLYVSSTSTLTFATLDGSNITAVSSGTDNIKIIGSRNHEYATARTAVSTKEVEKYNYAQIFSETVATSGRYQAGDKYTNGKSHKDQVKKKIEEMKFQVERNLIMSTERGSVTDSSKYRFTYGYGLLGFISTNVSTYTAGSLTETSVDNHFKAVFAKGSKFKKHFAGADQIQELNNIVKAKYQVIETANTKEYGASLGKYITPFGVVELLWDPVLDGKFADYGFTLDSDNVKLRYMANDEKGSRKFRVEPNVQTPGTDGKESKILMDLGLQVTNEETCGILKAA
ncbi:MAG: hypothetical protein D6732_00050 [Methanobacteriota archaeon]|nr:MAG: hypothetical protein D6732_00050 [Euryarchaeota archaeon]